MFVLKCTFVVCVCVCVYLVLHLRHFVVSHQGKKRMFVIRTDFHCLSRLSCLVPVVIMDERGSTGARAGSCQFGNTRDRARRLHIAHDRFHSSRWAAGIALGVVAQAQAALHGVCNRQQHSKGKIACRARGCAQAWLETRRGASKNEVPVRSTDSLKPTRLGVFDRSPSKESN